jgi:Pyruvate/2-oxoacid:ferredoxin oxidoreductase delta subunit
LKILFSPREAELVADLPIKPFSVNQAAQNWKMDPLEAHKILDNLASRAILLDYEQPDGSMTYVVPPPMAGFFEFSMMRVRDDIDQQTLAEKYHQYCTVEPEFMHHLFDHQTQMGRVFVNEPLLPDVEVLDYERASEVIRTSTHRGITLCYCRRKNQALGQACSAPLDICMTFNGPAEALIRHGHARSVDVPEMLDHLQRAYEHNLVQFGENVRQDVSFICNCCGCCCEALVGARRFNTLRPIFTSNFLPVVDETACNGCGKCVQACPMEAMTLVSSNDPHQPRRMRARLDAEICLGCGVCARTCTHKGLKLEQRKQRLVTPFNTTHRIVMMAIEKGTLQNLIFDNHILWSQRALAALLGSILRLPPIKQALASQQVKSRYMEALIKKITF